MGHLIRNGLLALALLGAQAAAETVSLPLTDDTWINGRSPNSVYGGQSSLFLHDYGPKSVLLNFDAAGILGSGVATATLRLTLTAAKAPGSVTVFAITAPWGEDSVSYATRPNRLRAQSVLTIGADDLAGLAAGPVVIEVDVRDPVSGWAAGSLAPHGLYFETNDPVRAFFAAGTAELIVETDGSGSTASPGVLDLSVLPAIIDQPGEYALDQDWILGTVAGSTTVIDVQTQDAVLDLRGFTIFVEDDGTTDSIIHVADGAAIEVVNGKLWTQLLCRDDCETSTGPAVGGKGFARIKHVRLDGGVYMPDGSAHLEHVSSGRPMLAARLTAQHSQFRCSYGDFCLEGLTANLRANFVACSRFCRSAIKVADGSLVDGNRLFSLNEPLYAIAVSGDFSVIKNNFSSHSSGGFFSVGLLVEGSRNVLKNNFGPLGPIDFRQDGNSYGDNRTGPIVLNGTLQNDWGGNGPFRPPP